MHWTTTGDRPITLGQYLLDTENTVRGVASYYGVSKSTVHKDLTLRLPEISPALAADVKRVLEKNKSERHLRGGEATRQMYLRKKEKQ